MCLELPQLVTIFVPITFALVVSTFCLTSAYHLKRHIKDAETMRAMIRAAKQAGPESANLVSLAYLESEASHV